MPDHQVSSKGGGIDSQCCSGNYSHITLQITSVGCFTLAVNDATFFTSELELGSMAHELRNKEKVTLNFENVQNVFQYLAFAVITYV